MTKSQANKLGKSLRRNLNANEVPTSECLNNLQEYRTSFKDDVSSVFEKLAILAKETRKDSISSFRIKRIESILSKIKREPTMALGNMGDIAGCRVLLYSEFALKKLIEKIHLQFDVKYVNDYLENSKEDGYRGYHIYIYSPNNNSRLIEIQLRTIESHKWASMVEIIDILFNLKIKEGQTHKEFERFHLLFANKKNLSLNEKKELIKIDIKHNIHSKLNEVFIKNHLKIWNEWINLNKKEDSNYFIIEVDENKTSNIISFDSYEIAESSYFTKFKESKNSHFVLTKIEKSNFKRICIAYASYVLIKHDYLEDWTLITNDIIDDLIEKKEREELIFFSKHIYRNMGEQIELIESELQEIKDYQNNEGFDYNAWTEWLQELGARLQRIKEIYKGETAKNERTKNFLYKIFGGQ
ncbi:RelA/SpoT domain-containing protein [Flagellimonas sp.]|jgi:ppGpp synthetase/RelA/SpoT-type nucleotidyltranferase|uniref:RelA/SpoT domain-containing protein n=1 Tax=Flagellimonas sp. TaxID=2058762 RepID=UPI003BAB0B9C